ncbi:hypothetical protein ACQKWADRAFT_315113 [Trichoderma austrokoningii]
MGFKVIIIGGGPVGLFLANGLQKCSIDYVLFEKRQTIPPTTAFGIFLWPQVTRMMHQLGLLDRLGKVSHPMTGIIHSAPSGEQLSADTIFSKTHQTHGYPVVVTDRGSLANTLLSGINDPEKHIFTGKQLENIIQQEKGVTVEFTDGTKYDGSVVIGADGIWSTVRDQIRQNAPKGLFLKNPYEASYKGIFGRGPLVDGITSGQGIEVHGDGWLIQAFPSQKETHMFIYKRIPSTTTKIPFSSVVTDDDIAEFYDAKLTPQVSFKEIWDKRYAQGTANYEEGVCNLWHYNRIAMISPKQGVAANVGMEAAATLTNKLAFLLQNNQDPTTEDINKAFSTYQSELEGKVGVWQRLSRFNLESAVESSGPLLEAMSTNAAARVPTMVSKSFKFDYVPFEHQYGNELPWVH